MVLLVLPVLQQGTSAYGHLGWLRAIVESRCICSECLVMLAVLNREGAQSQRCCHHCHRCFHVLHGRKGYFHRSEGPQELGTRSQRLSGVGHGVGNVWAAFRVVG
jgi:hypothetical protein